MKLNNYYCDAFVGFSSVVTSGRIAPLNFGNVIVIVVNSLMDVSRVLPTHYI